MFICCETIQMLRERERETQNSEQCINKIYARQQITSSKIIQIRTAYFDLETASKIVHVVCLFNQTKDDREKKSVWRKAWQIFIHGFALCPEAFVSLLSFIYSHAGFVCVCVLNIAIFYPRAVAPFFAVHL